MSSPRLHLRPFDHLPSCLLLGGLLACTPLDPAASQSDGFESSEAQGVGASELTGAQDEDSDQTDPSTSADGDNSDASDTATDAGATGDGDGDGDGSCVPSQDGQSDPFIDCVEWIESPEASFYNHDMLPGVVLGPPRGSLDTVSLGCGGQLVVFFDDPIIVDGPGVDFIVFENPFAGFPEPAQVSVSQDGEHWVSFDCDPDTLEGCAGVATVHAQENNGVDPTDPQVAGGDQFDLADIGVSQARYLRFDDVSDTYWGSMGMDWCDPGQGGKAGFDLDAAAIVNAESI